jgi:hypothetical protein
VIDSAIPDPLTSESGCDVCVSGAARMSVRLPQIVGQLTL